MPTTFIGKSGADAVFKYIHLACKVISKYGAKLKQAIDYTATAGIISVEQATIAKQFVEGAEVLCDIFKLVSENSGFPTP